MVQSSAPAVGLLQAPSGDRAAALSRWCDGLGFALFLMSVLTLFCRPADLVPALDGLSIYETIVAACLLFSIPRMWELLTPRSLREHAITTLVLSLTPAVVLSHLAHANTYDARLGGAEMAKACVMFLLVVTHAT